MENAKSLTVLEPDGQYDDLLIAVVKDEKYPLEKLDLNRRYILLSFMLSSSKITILIKLEYLFHSNILNLHFIIAISVTQVAYSTYSKPMMFLC